MFRLLRQWIIDTLGFTRSEANGTLLLMFIVLVTLVVPRIVLLNTNSTDKSFGISQDSLKNWTNQLEASIKIKEKKAPEANEPVIHKERFQFDPNTASTDELKRLGFSHWVASNIVSYRSKGGSYHSKKDLKKIYGISEDQLNDVWELITLPEVKPALAIQKPSPPKEEVSEKHEEEIKFDLNMVSAEKLMEIRGIGPVLSDRIVKYRDLLGGFHSPNQLKEVYGLDSSVVSKIIDRSFLSPAVSKVNINTDSLNHLMSHPYIDYKLARTIYNFRTQRGRLDSVEQIKSIKILSDSLYEKIYPYLSLNP